MKTILSFIFGAAAGSGITYFVVKKTLTSKYDDLRASELAEMREHYKSVYENNKNAEMSLTEPQNGTSEEVKETPKKKATKKSTKSSSKSSKKTNYASMYESSGKMIKESSIEDADDDTEEDVVDEIDTLNYSKREAYKRGIELIEEEDYISRDGNDPVDCYYYMKDEILTNDEDIPFDGFLDYVGYEWLDKFNAMSNPYGKVVYVRNNQMGMKFMITCVKGSYISHD